MIALLKKLETAYSGDYFAIYAGVIRMRDHALEEPTCKGWTKAIHLSILADCIKQAAHKPFCEVVAGIPETVIEGMKAAVEEELHRMPNTVPHRVTA